MRRYSKILKYAWPHRRLFFAIFGLTLAVSAFSILQPLPTALVFDHLLGSSPLAEPLKTIIDSVFPNAGRPFLLGLFVIAGVVIYLLNSLLDVALTYAWTLAGRRMVNGLMLDLFARLQRRSLLFHSRNDVGDSLSRVMVDSWCVHTMLDTLFFAPLLALLTMAGMIVLMASFQPGLTLIALGVAPFMVAASFMLGGRLRNAAKQRRDVETRIQSHVQQILSGIPVVQAFAQENREYERFQLNAAAAIRSQQQTVLLTSVGGFSSGLITTLGTGLILGVGAHYVGIGRLTIGGLWLFIRYLNILQTQIKTLAAVYPAAQGFRASVDRIVETLETKPEVVEKPGAVALASSRGHIRIEDVTVGYEPNQPVLRDITLEIIPGETLAIVGATGAGKSTLVALIARLLDPWQGRVLIDGNDLRDLQLISLRSQIAMVLQEPFLFPLTIAENIAYGRPGASREEIVKAAQMAHADKFIEKLPEGYDTVMGERGATLSGGERQRLSIARALLKDAPILILDEPTSALDAQTESLLMEALQNLMKGRTTLIIAHRLSTARRADRIIVLKEGRIGEVGTHAELMGQGGLYAHFYNPQLVP